MIFRRWEVSFQVSLLEEEAKKRGLAVSDDQEEYHRYLLQINDREV